MKKKSKISKILLRVPNWIGDAVMSLPALDELSALYEGASITVLAKPWTAPVFVNNPNVASIIEYDSNGVHKGLLGRIALARELRKIGFDMAVLFQNAFDAAFISFLAGIPRRIGFARDLRSPLLTYAIEISKDIMKQHQGFYYIN
ncbi:MAG: glycosyltransferase family 9 protein, partial [Deltaproteobacteria bacterium]|nr:glycosyltransferase family 9 protein [Deltaproteobacteria bacterium]